MEALGRRCSLSLQRIHQAASSRPRCGSGEHPGCAHPETALPDAKALRIAPSHPIEQHDILYFIHLPLEYEILA